MKLNKKQAKAPKLITNVLIDHQMKPVAKLYGRLILMYLAGEGRTCKSIVIRSIKIYLKS